MMVIGETKRAPSWWSGARVRVLVGRSESSAGRRLAGAIGKTSEGVRVADGDVGQHLAVDLETAQLEAVHERRVGQAVLARGGVDPLDPQTTEVALAVAPVAVGVLVGLEQGLLGALVVRVRL